MKILTQEIDRLNCSIQTTMKNNKDMNENLFWILFYILILFGVCMITTFWYLVLTEQ